MPDWDVRCSCRCAALTARPCCWRAPLQQQALLEEETTLGRLKAVQELLSGTVKYLSAQVALQSAFKTTGGGGANPPPGGPD
jgi:hypothetical protein